ncbi:hypothetical protein N7468_008637 [Penicillium chermesinum]|uniref:Mediator of RNA polymerase II transcription subunit 18 n=1 Tax=Penicillium chermesinum TaxID=63820 RepID=A0A9W9NQ32_9EURO|nr:uncharacterized protein N7468_008637 [Penicillium chermesinum]KAJ5224095.1 hypothetical protein N7468_008637 [Penicillium chermesinum]KAJ6155090.1 hypothetical protein N7470_005656 [Penicillium chermesinum]
MHELLLFASVPQHQHHELLQQLAGLTAMQPRHALERRLIFKAYRKPGLGASRTGGSQDLQASGDLQRVTKMLNGGMFYTQVVGPVAENDFSPSGPDADVQMSGTEGNSAGSAGAYDYEQQPWRLEFRDVPEAGTRSAVTARVMATAALPCGDVVPAMNAWGYHFVTEYVVEGDMFTYGDIVLFLHRVLHYPSTSLEDKEPRKHLPALSEMSVMEKSGSYVLQASMTVLDGSNQETMKTASRHLFALREKLRSAVKLEMADRLSLDTRAK